MIRINVPVSTEDDFSGSIDLSVASGSELVPDAVLKNIEAIIELETRHESSLPLHQQIIEKTAASFGQPWFLYFQLIFFIGWWFSSQLLNERLVQWQVPRFNIYEQGLDAASLLIATGVLIYQARQEKVAEERSHLVLQLNLLTEQKIAKLIALVEELRTDLPNVRNRYDSEAFEMQKTTNPQVVLNALKETLNATALTKEGQEVLLNSSESLTHDPTAIHDEELD
ncbi:MAG: DUF1003 domain-containing protein [Timaviella obliquedivisa GSE-PSE-MK23-08B]|jgi:uncharacterized membrane protein|nr:DUF1003 domain-containing protein [Timaviella obliquedivisa GSE-PSE-MK23-08B]